MEPTFTGKVENGIVVDAIVGTAEWAREHLGGEWYDSNELIYLPGVWTPENGFQPMPNVDEPLME